MSSVWISIVYLRQGTPNAQVTTHHMEFAVKKFFIYRAKGDGTYRTPQPWKKKHALLQKWNLRIKVWDLDKKEVPNQASNPLLSCTTCTGGHKTLTFGLFWVNSVLGWCRSENLRHLEHAIKERDSIGRGMVLVRDHMRTALKVEHVTTPRETAPGVDGVLAKRFQYWTEWGAQSMLTCLHHQLGI